MEIATNSLLIADIIQIHAYFGIAAANIQNGISWLDVLVYIATELRIFTVPER